jgi:hypothetical protein
VSGVFRNIDPPPIPSPPGECVPPRLWCGGRTHSQGGEGVGGQLVRKTPDTALYSIYVSTLWPDVSALFVFRQMLEGGRSMLADSTVALYELNQAARQYP